MKAEETMAVIHKAHDLLHQGDIEGAHEALHCGVNRQPLKREDAATGPAALLAFSVAFSALCREHKVAAAFLAIMPRPGQGEDSLQVGGAVSVVEWIKGRLL